MSDSQLTTTGGGSPVERRFDVRAGDGHSASTSVVLALAELVDADPLAAEEILSDNVDPDALDALFRHDGSGEWRLQFTMWGCEVEVGADGTAVVRAPGQ